MYESKLGTEKEKKIKYFIEQREKEKNLIRKRLKNYNEKYNKLDYLINHSNSLNKENYLYNKMKKNFEKEENDFSKKSISERKKKNEFSN